MEIFDISQKGHAQKIYSFESVKGSINRLIYVQLYWDNIR